MGVYSKEDIIRIVREEEIEFVRLQFTDIFGMLKNVAITASQIEKAVSNQCMFDGSSIEGFVRIDESDQYLYPDLKSFRVFPWRPSHGKVARLICDVYNTDGTPFVGDPRYVLKRVIQKANDMGYKLLINYERCPDFLELALRQGVYAAIDRQSVVDSVFRGAGTVGSAGYVPQGSLYYNENVVQYPYDPEAARAVFAGKGYSVTLLCGDDGDDLAIAEIIRNGLTAAGIEVAVEAHDSSTRDGRTLFSDESKFSGTNPHSMGAIGYSNAEMTALAEGQMYETDFDKRVELFQELELLVSREIPIIVIANQSSYSMYRKDVYDGWMKTYAYQQAEQNRLSYMAR